jgi:hypothetical protein
MQARSKVIGLATLLCATAGGAQQTYTSARLVDAPAVDVWMNHSEYRPFEKAEVGFVAPAGSYLLVMRIADDGYTVKGINTVEILYPSPASSQHLLSAADGNALSTEFTTRGGPGTTGAVFAVASSKPFDLSKIATRFAWHPGFPVENRQEIAGRILEKVGVTPGDVLGVAVDAYDVVKTYGTAAQRPHRSQNDFSTDLFRRCEQGSKDEWCRSFRR